MSRYLLDTNIVSHFLRGHRAVDRAMVAHPIGDLCISALTSGEIHFGIARRPAGVHFAIEAQQFLAEVEILPWDNRVAPTYGKLRASLQRSGFILAEMDLLIAAHALSVGAVLVTNDQAILRLPGLEAEDWTRDP
ncbi:MAG: type II toxin-antitoxin system VapC family toxin [Thermomicrobiales bacterium]|nr:type II toxin-antitoxin system VapC family toxin [Thermomicrobiales bacterium]